MIQKKYQNLRDRGLEAGQELSRIESAGRLVLRRREATRGPSLNWLGLRATITCPSLIRPR